MELQKHSNDQTSPIDLASLMSQSDKQVAKAINERKKSKLFRSLPLSEMCKLMLVLGELMGIPSEKMPSKEGIMLIANFAMQHYGQFTVDEIKTAFMLAAAGELESEGHYQVFSAKYFGAVMNAYKAKANTVFYEMKEEVKELPPPEGEVDWSDTWQYLTEKAKVKEMKDMIIPEPIYDWLVKTDKLKLDVSQRLELFKKARFSLIGEINLALATNNTKPQAVHELQALKGEIKKGTDLYNKVLIRAKILAIQELLKQSA